MSSQNPSEVMVVKNELLKAGIVSETRCQPMAGSSGASGVELWVQDEKDFSEASRLYGRMQDRPTGRAGGNGADLRRASKIGREELRRARLLLEKAIEESFQRESELTKECATLRSKAEELSRAIAQGQEWQKQLNSREELLKKTQLRLETVTRLLETQQIAVAALKEDIAALELQREEQEKSLCQARTEALAEREARIAAEERAAKAGQTKKSLETELLHRKELEQQMHAHVVSLSSLCGRMQEKSGKA